VNVFPPSTELNNERVLATETNVLDLTDNGAGNTIVISVATNGITFAKIQQIATARFVGRTTAATGDVEQLTGTQATALLDAATTSLKGVVKQSTNVANAVASTVSVDSADATDLATVITLANELKADVNQLVTDLNAVVTQINAKFAADTASGQMA